MTNQTRFTALIVLNLLALGCSDPGPAVAVSTARNAPIETQPVVSPNVTPPIIPALEPSPTPTPVASPTPEPSPTPTQTPVYSFSGGDGSSASPYVVRTATDLQAIAGALSANFELAEDIDLTRVSFTTLGDTTHPFSGYLNGNGHQILGFHQTLSGAAAFIQTLTGTVYNLRFVGTLTSTGGGGAAFVVYLKGGRIDTCTLAETLSTGYASSTAPGALSFVLRVSGVVTHTLENGTVNGVRVTRTVEIN